MELDTLWHRRLLADCDDAVVYAVAEALTKHQHVECLDLRGSFEVLGDGWHEIRRRTTGKAPGVCNGATARRVAAAAVPDCSTRVMYSCVFAAPVNELICDSCCDSPGGLRLGCESCTFLQAPIFHVWEPTFLPSP